MHLLLGLILFSLSAFSVDWYNLEPAKTYQLKQSFQLPQTERSSSKLDFTKGEEFVLREISPLDMINVILYHFDYKNCPGPAMQTEMEIIPVQATSPVVEIGAQLEEKCDLLIFIESKDLMTSSLFE